MAYVVVVSTLKVLFLSNRRVYFYVYWASEPGDVVLSVLSVHESFRRAFGDFYRLKWTIRRAAGLPVIVRSTDGRSMVSHWAAI
jgi:hypothetical protein